MKKKIFTQISAVLLLGLFAVSASALAEDIKARMKTRLPFIQELKAKGVVGENNKGYLEFIGGQKESADVVAAENNDRETVYAAIAKQQGTTAELVGKRRALQIANRAKPGQWVQDASGNWLQKE
jgi:uncharacterized protein YdbL (DUF1318 family)